jgi:Domain of unknown function (DUF4158)
MPVVRSCRQGRRSRCFSYRKRGPILADRAHRLGTTTNKINKLLVDNSTHGMSDDALFKRLSGNIEPVWADPSRVKRYLEREKTRLKHQREVARVYGYTSFASAEAELLEWVDARAWMTEIGLGTT